MSLYSDHDRGSVHGPTGLLTPFCTDNSDSELHPFVSKLLRWDDNDQYSKYVSATSSYISTRPHLNVQLQGVPCPALVDSGAEVSLFDAALLRQMSAQPNCIPTTTRIFDIQQKSMPIAGKYLVNIETQGHRFAFPMFAIYGLGPRCVLGFDFQKHSNMILEAATGNVTFHKPTAQVALASASPKPSETTTFLVEPAEDRWIYPNESRCIPCYVSTPAGYSLQPGSTVMVESSPQTGIYSPEALVKVSINNKLMLLCRNNLEVPVKLVRNAAIPGITVERCGEAYSIAEVTKSTLTELSGGQRKPQPLTPEKRKYLLDNLNLDGVDPIFKEKYQKFVLDNHDVFSSSKSDLGCSSAMEHEIFMRNNESIYVPQFPIPAAHQDFIETWVKEMTAARVIVPCKSRHNSPIFAVRKKSGGLRIVQDLRAQNMNSLEDKYSILDTRECINKLGALKPRVFSTLDLSGAFWQLPLHPASRPYTAFTVPHMNKQFMWHRAAMGLKGCPASFSRLMGLVTEGLEGVVTYVDDLMAGSQNHDDHIKSLYNIAERLRQHNLKLNIHKCVMGRSELSYLGYHVSAKGISPELSKLEAIKKLQPPSTVKQVMEVLGLFNFFRMLIKNFSRIAQPLSQLTSKKSGYKSGKLPPKAYEAFRTLQSLLCSRPVAAYPDPTKPYTLYVDAALGSEEKAGGIGAVLTQKDENGHDTMVSCFSRTLRDHECNYSAFAVEKLAISRALDYFRTYIIGKPVKVFSDHAPIQGHSRRAEKTLSELQQQISQFDADIQFLPGVSNGAADCLSRNALPIKGIAAVSVGPLPVADEQKKDKTIQAIRDFVEHKKVPTSESVRKLVEVFAHRCVIRDDILYMLESRRGQHPKARAWLPESLRHDAISREHGTPMSGHWRTERTFERTLATWFWPSMAKDIAEFVERCPTCYAIDDQHATKTRQPLQPWQQARRFNDRVHLDLVGPLKSSGQNCHIMVAIDAFSKFVELVAIPDKSAETVANAFFKMWLCRYSAPQLVVSDGGKEFSNQLMAQLLRLTNGKLHVVSPLHPIANGQCERFNRSLKAYIKSFIDDSTLSWEPLLPGLQFAHNTSINRSTLHTPYYLVFMEDPTLPWALTNPFRNNVPNNANGQRFKAMMEARKIVMRNNEDARRAYKEYYDRKAQEKNFEPGDKVFVHFPDPPKGTNKKFYIPWKGLYRVLDQLQKGVLKIEKVMDDKDGKQPKQKLVHKNRVKPFHAFNDNGEAEITFTDELESEPDYDYSKANQEKMTEEFAEWQPWINFPTDVPIPESQPQTQQNSRRGSMTQDISLPAIPQFSSTPLRQGHMPAGPEESTASQHQSFNTPNSSIQEVSPPPPVQPPPTILVDNSVAPSRALDKVAVQLFPEVASRTRRGGVPRGWYDFKKGGVFVPYNQPSSS